MLDRPKRKENYQTVKKSAPQRGIVKKMTVAPMQHYQRDPNNPNALKRAIHADWLQLDSNALARAIAVSPDGYVSSAAIGQYSEAHAPMLAGAFAAWCGINTRGPGGIYAADWKDFLADLRRARRLVDDPYFEIPESGVVYRCKV